jgi:hypothetical protein
MEVTLAGADDMVRTWDDAGIKLFVVRQNRYNLPVRKLPHAIEAGRFGKLVMGTVRVRWIRKTNPITTKRHGAARHQTISQESTPTCTDSGMPRGQPPRVTSQCYFDHAFQAHSSETALRQIVLNELIWTSEGRDWSSSAVQA